MKRLGLVLLVAAVAAGGVVYTVRRSQSASAANVTTLLPRETIALAHLPDFKQARDEWHQADL